MAVITSPDFLIVDGVSSETIGLYIDTPPVVPMAAQRVSQWATGIDADFFQQDDVFDPVKISIPAYLFFRKSDFDLSNVYAFFANAKKIQLSRFSGRYLKIRAVSGITPAHQWDGERIKMKIDLLCDPFKYFSSNEPFSVIDPAVTNPGTRYSRPLYKITHSGSGCNLVVNGQICKIQSWTDKNGITTQPPSPIWIDAERMIAYSMTGTQKVNATKFTDGAFPFLMPGQNTAYTTGNTLEITGNWRDY